MSGICGICQPGAEEAGASLGPMLSALALPGEPQRDAFGEKSVALGVARRWPFQQVAAIPGVRIAVDADLCNVPELAQELASEGLDASQMSLAELLGWLYLCRGPAFVDSLRGAFSFAVWDEKAKRLLLGIDRLGIKSLYWCQERDRLLFASRAGAVRAGLNQPADVNPTALMQYLLCSVVPAPLAIYRGMEKLRPGFLLVFENGRVRQQQYWELEFPESENHDVAYWAREVREALRAAVHLHVDGCAPETTGAYLSGGTDSSSVVAFMNELHSPVNTFSIFFQEARYNESGFAHTTARTFRTRHHEQCLGPRDALEAIAPIVEFYDEPFSNSSAMGAYYCAVLARESGVETLLAGDGGDELFAGNERYAKDKYFALYHSVPRWLRQGVIEPMARLLPQNGSWLSLPRRYIRRAQTPNAERLFGHSLFLSMNPEEILDAGFLAQVPPETWLEVSRAHFRSAPARSELNRFLYHDVKMTLADNDVRKVVGTAELAGIRVRFPLMDYRLAEFSGRIPANLKLKRFEKRYIFKKALQGILPRQVLYKKKHGFGVPLGYWLLHDKRLHSLMQDVLYDPRTRERGYFRPEFLHFLIDQQRREHASFYGEYLWRLLVLELWHRQHFERGRLSLVAH